MLKSGTYKSQMYGHNAGQPACVIPIIEGPRTRVVYPKIKYGILPKECKIVGKYG